MRDGGLTAIEHAGHVGIDDVVPVLGGHGHERLESTDAGVVDENVEPAERGHRLIDHARDVELFADVRDNALHRAGEGAQLLVGVLDASRPDAAERHAAAALGQRLHDGEADAATPAGDERDPALQC